MRRLFGIAILCVWLVMIVILVQRSAPPPPAPMAPAALTQPVVGEEWMGVYHQGQKVGYTRHSLSADGDGFVFSDESLLRLVVLDTPQTVRTRIRGHTTASFALRDVAFELNSGVGDLRAEGVVMPTELRLTMHTGKEVTQQVLPLTEPIYLPSTLRASASAGALRPGTQVEALVFDPTTLKNGRTRLAIGDEEAVPQAAPDVRGWRVREEFRGIETTAWITATGRVLREEGPMGFVLVSETAEQAVNQGWSPETARDLVSKVAVPVARPIDDARERRSLRLRLSGIALEQVPSDDDQVRQGAVLTISRPNPQALKSYPLPYRATEQAADLAATAFLQSDHPRIKALAQQVIGDERDAQRAAIRLNDWVYEHLRKVPTVSIPNALQVLDMGEGDCNEHAVLLAALGRAAGLPTRVIAGAVYLDGAFLYHAWCEVWLGRWVSIDPALHQFPADATHIKFVVGGPDEQLAMIGIIGRLEVEVLDPAQPDA